MNVPFIDIHTHPYRMDKQVITVQNIFPGEGFAAFSGRNFYSVGLHPWHISTPEENNKMLRIVEDVLEFDHVIFVGECGLDKKIEKDFEEQKRIFKAQAMMAEEFEYPVIIHCVKAINEIIDLHNEISPALTWIMHGYNGSVELTKQLLEKNFLFSFGKILFEEKAKAIDSFRFLTLDKIFLETDEFEGGVEQIYKRAAEIKDVSIDEIKKSIWNNFDRIEKSITNYG